MESQDFEDREAIPRAENLLLSLEELLAAGLHIGTRIKTVDMEKYIFRVRPDGLFILNIGETNEKIRVAAKFMARFEPGRVLAVSSRLYGKTPIDRFAELTKAMPIVGRFMPGLISNPLQPKHAEPQVVLVTDPRADWQAIKEATVVPPSFRTKSHTDDSWNSKPEPFRIDCSTCGLQVLWTCRGSQFLPPRAIRNR